MKISNRALSYIIVALAYAAAIAVGVVCYIYLPLEQFWLKLLIADIIATAVIFAFSLILRNASVYDPYWSVQPLVIVIAYAIKTKYLYSVHILLLVAVLLWGIRLTANWAYTFHGLDHQDWRYTMLHDKTGKWYPLVNFFGIHLVPTLIVYGCVLPITFAFEYQYDLLLDTPHLIGCIVFFVVSITAVFLQGIADYEMHEYRKNRKGNFMRNGLWKYSRHPNYLGEILMWWGIALGFVCVLPSRWYLIAGAFANTLMFLFISIPLADSRQAKKPGFEEYKAQTRMLLPIRKRQK